MPTSGLSHSDLLDWALACQWWGMDWYGDWCELSGDEQAFLVAVYQTKMQEDAVVAHSMRKKRG